MSNVHCQLLETVIVRDLGVAIQVLDLNENGVQFSVQTASPRGVGQRAISDSAARRMVRDQLKHHAHAAAESLNQLHRDLEQRGAMELEPVVCRIYRQLRDLDSHIDAYLLDGQDRLPTGSCASGKSLPLPFTAPRNESVPEVDWDI
jgi:hypothetical protein